MIFCLEYYNALLNKQESYKSHYIITLDAICNGFQHITMLCKVKYVINNTDIPPASRGMIDICLLLLVLWVMDINIYKVKQSKTK